jgi:hypothetical protein
MATALLIYLGYAYTLGIILYIEHKQELSDLDD